jgi:hypothetical protein
VVRLVSVRGACLGVPWDPEGDYPSPRRQVGGVGKQGPGLLDGVLANLEDGRHIVA